MVAARGRTPAGRERLRDVLRSAIDRLNAVPEFRSKPVLLSSYLGTREEVDAKRSQGLPVVPHLTLTTYDALNSLFKRPFEKQLEIFVQAVLCILQRFHCSFLCKDEGMSFNTSEDPCILWPAPPRPFDPFDRSFLVRPQVMAAMAISPRRLMVLTNTKMPRYIDVGDDVVHQFNAILRTEAPKTFISNTETDYAEWYRTRRQFQKGDTGIPREVLIEALRSFGRI